MDLKSFFPVIALMLTLAFASCSNSDNSSITGDVKITTDSLTETGSFKKSNGELCEMKLNLVVSYPQEYKDSTTLQQLQQLFIATLLKAPKGCNNVKDAMSKYAKSLVAQNSPDNDGVTHASADTVSADMAGSDYDEIDVDRLESTIRIKVVYNANDVITYCREESIEKNGQNTSMSHHYVSLDLQEMKRVTLSDLFRDDSLDKLTSKLKEKLMDDKGASNEDELNDMGYFNLPNLTVTSNFFFTSRGVTWSYDSSTIAVASVGEPTINIDYDDLHDYLCDNSIIKRL
jgi:hypothetical protein